MTQAKMETAAQKYRRLKAEKDKQAVTYDWTCPDADCGMTWRLRVIDLNFFITSGLLPLHLVEKLVETAQQKGEQAALQMLNWKDQVESIVFASKVVRYVAMEPRIVDEPTETDIAPDEVMTCCYTGILRRALQGGEQAASLGNFRVE